MCLAAVGAAAVDVEIAVNMLAQKKEVVDALTVGMTVLAVDIAVVVADLAEFSLLTMFLALFAVTVVDGALIAVFLTVVDVVTGQLLLVQEHAAALPSAHLSNPYFKLITKFFIK